MKKCFAKNKGKCTALREMECEECNFYKTKKQAKKDRKKAMERIRSLDKKVQDHISKTYYKGGNPNDC